MNRNYLFKSKDISCKDAISCFFNLNILEVDVYNYLARKGSRSNKDLANELDRDRSTIYRALHKLISCGLVYETVDSVEGGGGQAIFSASPPIEVKKDLKKRLDKWVEKMDRSLEGLNDLDDEYNTIYVEK